MKSTWFLMIVMLQYVELLNDMRKGFSCVFCKA